MSEIDIRRSLIRSDCGELTISEVARILASLGKKDAARKLTNQRWVKK
jgi:hypothetical protein